MNRKLRAMVVATLAQVCTGAIAFAVPLAQSATLLDDTFEGTKLDETIWTKGGTTSPLQTVREGSLRLVSLAMMEQSYVVTKRGDFNFFRQPLTVVWDLVGDKTLAGPYAATPYSKAYGGLQIGATNVTKGVRGGAELGLTAWPGEVAAQGLDAPWFYTLNLGRLMPNDPTKSYGTAWLSDWRLSRVPQRIIWTLGPTDWTVEIKGATFVNGDPQKRSGKHELKEADFASSGFHLLMFASAAVVSMEPGVHFHSASVYVDRVDVLTSPVAPPPYTEAPRADALTIQTVLKALVGTDYSETAQPSRPQLLFGVNYASGTFRPKEGFVVPTEQSLNYWKSKGVMLMRLPFEWEHLQPRLNEPLDSQYVDALKKSVSLMGGRGMKVLLDLHNYAKYNGSLIGSTNVPVAAFANVWKRLAEAFKDDPAVWGYGLMNEPDRKADWPVDAQAAIDAIRPTDKKTQILVAVDELEKGFWAHPERLRDPAENLRFEFHMYCDHNWSGKYGSTYEYEINRVDARVEPMVGVKRLEPFVKWLKEHNTKGFIGEFSVPANLDRDPRWLVVLDNLCAYLRTNEIPNTFWAAGTLWTPGRSYVIEPDWHEGASQGKDRPQVQVLLKHARAYAKPAP